MEFRAPHAAMHQKSIVIDYLTENLSDPKAGQVVLDRLFEELGNAVDQYPDWHPIITAPQVDSARTFNSIGNIKAYKGVDHTAKFVRGFVTCPYSETAAEALVALVNEIPSLNARRLETPLYADTTFPVVIESLEIELEGDGTIRSRDALAWFVQHTVKNARNAQVAETWWNIRGNILGSPHGSRSSLFVNQNAGGHMRKILESMNDSGMFGPILEESLAMLSAKKRKVISENLLRAALSSWDNSASEFSFELRGEICHATINDTWSDNYELSIGVCIGDHDLITSGFYYPNQKRLEHSDPRGRRKIAEKFV